METLLKLDIKGNILENISYQNSNMKRVNVENPYGDFYYYYLGFTGL